MTQRSQRPSGNAIRHTAVDLIARLATRQLTDEQLIELLTRLEHELITRATLPEDHLLSERPADA